MVEHQYLRKIVYACTILLACTQTSVIWSKNPVYLTVILIWQSGKFFFYHQTWVTASATLRGHVGSIFGNRPLPIWSATLNICQSVFVIKSPSMNIHRVPLLRYVLMACMHVHMHTRVLINQFFHTRLLVSGSYNMGNWDLPDIYAHALRPVALGLGHIHISGKSLLPMYILGTRTGV